MKRIQKKIAKEIQNQFDQKYKTNLLTITNRRSEQIGILVQQYQPVGLSFFGINNYNILKSTRYLHSIAIATGTQYAIYNANFRHNESVCISKYQNVIRFDR